MIDIRQSTLEDLESFFSKKTFGVSSRSWSIFKDNVLACVFGYTIMRQGCIVFCDIKEGYGKVEVARTAKKAIKILADKGNRLIAVQDQEICNSERFLNFIGFRRLENSNVFEYVGEK